MVYRTIEHNFIKKKRKPLPGKGKEHLPEKPIEFQLEQEEVKIKRKKDGLHKYTRIWIN